MPAPISPACLTCLTEQPPSKSKRKVVGLRTQACETHSKGLSQTGHRALQEEDAPTVLREGPSPSPGLRVTWASCPHEEGRILSCGGVLRQLGGGEQCAGWGELSSSAAPRAPVLLPPQRPLLSSPGLRSAPWVGPEGALAGRTPYISFSVCCTEGDDTKRRNILYPV